MSHGPRSTSSSGAYQLTTSASSSSPLRRAFSVATATACADQSVASTRPPASAAAIDGSASPQPSSSTRAPRSERPCIARASASPLGHSSTQ